MSEYLGWLEYLFMRPITQWEIREMLYSKIGSYWVFTEYSNWTIWYLTAPIIGFILVLIIKEEYSIWITLGTFIVNTMHCILAFFIFILNLRVVFFSLDIELWQTMSFNVDGLSLFYMLLTNILLVITMIIVFDDTYLTKVYCLALVAINILLNIVFTIRDLFGFYISFEALIIPMFIIIGVWGARKEKVKAAYYFMMYTVGGSIILLLGILKVWSIAGSTTLEILKTVELTEGVKLFLFIGFLLSFAAKIPLFPFHIWLPLAHVEAPLAGSILLAGLLIKLGTYGFIRFALPLTSTICIKFAPFIIMLSLISIIYASLSTIRQTDLKRIIAYSSIAHMGIANLSIFTFTKLGISASVILQLAHGLVSSALFILVTILYNHHHTRAIIYFRGMSLTMPLFSSLFVFFNLCNIGMPLTGNFIGEFLSILAGFQYSPIVAIIASISIVLSACYALYLVARICYGESSPYIELSRDLNRKEFYSLLVLTILILLIGIFPNVLIYLINSGLRDVLTNFK